MLCLITGPGLRLTSPANSRNNANLNVSLERGISSISWLKQKLRLGRLCRYVKDFCVLMYFEGVEITSDDCGSVLHKVDSWLLEAAEQHKN